MFNSINCVKKYLHINRQLWNLALINKMFKRGLNSPSLHYSRDSGRLHRWHCPKHLHRQTPISTLPPSNPPYKEVNRRTYIMDHLLFSFTQSTFYNTFLNRCPTNICVAVLNRWGGGGHYKVECSLIHGN